MSTNIFVIWVHQLETTSMYRDYLVNLPEAFLYKTQPKPRVVALKCQRSPSSPPYIFLLNARFE